MDGPRGIDQPNVAEGLGKVAEVLATLRVDLLGQQADVVDVTVGSLEHLAGLIAPASGGKHVGEPECAKQEGALVTVQPVDTGVSLVALRK